MPNQINGNRWLIAFALWVPLVFTLTLLFWAGRGQHLRDLDAQWVLHTVQVKDQIGHLDSLVKDVGAGERGYLLTGDESFLPLYESALREIPTQSDRLAHLIEDNPTQVAAVAHLRTLIAEKLLSAAQALSLARKEKIPETIEMFRDSQGETLNDEIRSQVAAMTAEEDRLLAERESTFASRVKSERNEMIGLVVMEVALIVGLTLLLLRSRRLQLTADTRIGEAHAMTDQAQASTLKAMARTEEAEVRAVEANTRTEEVEMRGEEAIRASELRYRRLFETAQDGIIVLDAGTGGVVDANPFMKDLLGYSQEEMLGRKLWEIGPFKGAAASKIAFSNLVKSGRIQNENLSLEKKDGQQIEVEFISSAYRMDDNLLVQCNIRNITERKKSERDLTLLHTCISHLSDMVLITEADSTDEPGPRIVFANEAFERMTGYTPEETLGRSPRFLQGPKTDRRVLDEIHQAVAEKKPIRRQIVNYRKDGTEFWLDIDIVPIFDAAGKCTHFAGIERDISVEKKTTESLGLFRTLMDRSPDAIYVIDPETGRLLDVNATACERLGYSREEMLGLSISDIVIASGEESAFSREIASGDVRKAGFKRFEGVNRKKDGSTFPVEANVQHIELDRDYHVAVVRDITERKKTEERLRQKQTELQVLVDLIPAMVWFKDTENNILRVNKRVADAAGKSVEEIEGKSTLEIYPQQSAKFYADDLEVIASGVPKLGIIETLRGGEGQALWVQTDKVPYRDQDGKAIGIVVMGQDITERKRATEQIAEQAALLDEAQDAIIVRDLEGKVIFWNKGAERMYGWTRHEVLGLDAGKLLFRNPKRFAEVSALTISEGKWSGDLHQLTKDKCEITVEARWTLIRDNEGQPKSVLAINTDVTEKKKIEGQFMRAQRMESIGTLAGGIAHDLNNILAPIMMSIDILKLTATDPQAKSILDTIEVSSKRGSDIVRQVLSFARGLEGERVEIQPTHLLKDLESIIKNTFPKNIRLQFSIPNDIWMILGDPTQVHQILLNLCVNARDAMPNGGNLTIGIENCELDEQYAAMNLQAKAGRFVSITVTDSGTGIPQGILDKIFDPFFTTKEVNEGTGLGLSTVMAIVKSHAGIINVYSEPGKGTTFKVYLPAKELSLAAQRHQTQQISVPRGKGETVLVIDDEPSILNVTSQSLQAFGYRVLTATDGAEAVAVYAEHKNGIAVVITDMSMPIMDGAALIRTLTKINPTVKIIAASGLTANGDVAKVSGVTVKHFLTKPYTAGTLLKTMRAILDET